MSTFLRQFATIVGLLLAFAITQAQAQQVSDATFGTIPDSLFNLDPGETADTPYVITNQESDISFRETGESIIAVIDRHVRLKVFDSTVREASIVAIPYYFENDMEQLTELNAITHLPSGRQVRLQPSQIKTINLNARYNVKEFTMPQVEDGAILEYSYTVERRYIEELPDFFLSHKVPTLAAKLTITYPKYLRYEAFTENYSDSLYHDFVYTDTSSVPKIFTIPQPKPVVTERWMARNIPAVQEEPFISSLDDHRGKIKFLLSEFGLPRQKLENSWEVAVARIREKANPWEMINRNVYAEAKGDSIARALGSTSPTAIQDSIYRFLNERVNFSGAHASNSTETEMDVISGMPVDQAAINQTLVAMLRGAGIEANPVMVSTRQSGKINMDFPSFYQFNGQLVQSRIDGQAFLMDASFAHSEPGLIPVDMYSSPGLLIRQDAYEWIDIQPSKSNFGIQVNIDAQLRSDGSLEGDIRAVHRGYPAQLIRQQRADGQSDTQILKRILFDGYPQMTTDSVRITQVDDYDIPVRITARFEIENYAVSFTDGLKFRPMIVGYQSENPFADSTRTYPVMLDAPEKLDVSYSIALPPGYRAPQGRDSQTLSLPGAQFQEVYNIQEQELNYEYHIDIAQKEFSTDFFPQLYNFYERWVELSNTAWLIKN
jgi:hypothetical protein